MIVIKCMKYAIQEARKEYAYYPSIERTIERKITLKTVKQQSLPQLSFHFFVT